MVFHHAYQHFLGQTQVFFLEFPYQHRRVLHQVYYGLKQFGILFYDSSYLFRCRFSVFSYGFLSFLGIRYYVVFLKRLQITFPGHHSKRLWGSKSVTEALVRTFDVFNAEFHGFAVVESGYPSYGSCEGQFPAAPSH